MRNSWKEFLKKSVNVCQPWLGREEYPDFQKCLFHHSENKSLTKNKYTEENTTRQCLIPFRKNSPVN